MTAFELIREGYGVWAEGALTHDYRAAPVVFALLFLLGFLATSILRTLRIPRAIVADTSFSLSDVDRGIIDNANTARLFELESELAASKDSLNRFTETLSTTFANMSDGLAIFDADKSLYLFNPALSELLDLDPVWLARRPSISDFISRLREKRHLPEKRNFLAWRRLLTELCDTAQKDVYNEEWFLPDGRVFRVSGQAHPRGAVAFLFEDISESVARDRQRRREAKMYESTLNTVSDVVVIIHPSGRVKFANRNFLELFDEEACETLHEQGLYDFIKKAPLDPEAAIFWSKVKAFVSTSGKPAPWKDSLTDQSGALLTANVSVLPDGSALVIVGMNNSNTYHGTKQITNQADPLNLVNLESMLRQRNISLDQNRFDLDGFQLKDSTKLRRIIWYLAINASDNCRAGGKITLSSSTNGYSTNLSCYVSKSDMLEAVRENLASSLLRQLVEQPDTSIIWNYDAEIDPFTVSFKSQGPLKLSAL